MQIESIDEIVVARIDNVQLRLRIRGVVELNPVVNQVWTKVQGEVATIQ